MFAKACKMLPLHRYMRDSILQAYNINRLPAQHSLAGTAGRQAVKKHPKFSLFQSIAVSLY